MRKNTYDSKYIIFNIIWDSHDYGRQFKSLQVVDFANQHCSCFLYEDIYNLGKVNKTNLKSMDLFVYFYRIMDKINEETE